MAEGPPGATALCIASTTVDPRCGPDDFAFCDGAILHSCQTGYITAVTPCGAPEDCIAEASRPSFCRTDTTHHTPCDAASFIPTCTTRYGRCYRTSEGGCQAGFSSACTDGIVHETLCPADQSCTRSAECSDDPQIAQFAGSPVVATVTGKRVPPPVGP